MLILLSPAKSLDFSPSAVTTFTEPELLDEADRLIATLQKKSKKKVAALMSLSDSLAELNVERYQSYERPFVLNEGAKQALLAFKGDVYREWPLDTYSDDDFAFAQDHLRILSGLYGSLRPLDLIRPYRLEMGTQLKTRRGKNLYAFWGGRITEALNRSLDPSGDDLVINLASNEYFSAVKRSGIRGRIVSPVFKDWKNGRYKIISFFAKRARGAMADHLIRHRADDLQGLLSFEGEGYRYDAASSTEDAPVFLRKTS
jgi:cytoplasmic iron level regulating protein YaaA (DUF328/UPF0246 family)